MLFVPTAFPGSHEERFGWDRLEEAFARTPRRDRIATPGGVWSLATPEARAGAHRAVKLHVKDQPHAGVGRPRARSAAGFALGTIAMQPLVDPPG